MKTAFYVEEGRQQVVLTPETDMERRILDLMHAPLTELKVYKGSFYACVGGWTRHSPNKDSTIIVLDKATADAIPEVDET